MGKTFDGLPGIPTDDTPLWEQIQRASRSTVHWASVYAQSETEIHRQALLRAAREFNRLIRLQTGE